MFAKQTPPEQPDSDSIVIDDSGRPPEPKWWQLHLHWHHFGKRTKIITAFLALLLIAGVVFGLLLSKNVIAPGGGSKEVKQVIVSPLTGLPTTEALAKRPVTGIMIENSLDARPQSGLGDAGVVFEAIAEGGITRFLALFQETKPQYIGPVRSLRPYYIDWATPFNASIAHVGGSPTALAQIRQKGRDLDQFFNAGSYWRINSRAAPHNVYTSFAKLDALNKAKGYKYEKFAVLSRKTEAPIQTPTASTINLAISGPLYSVRYVYQPKSNYYLRYEGGAAHTITVRENGVQHQLHPKVVIALVMPYGLAEDAHHSVYGTYGKGIAYIFQDGGVTKGTWIKKDRGYQFTFVGPDGKKVALNPGQTWLTMVGASADVSYKP